MLQMGNSALPILVEFLSFQIPVESSDEECHLGEFPSLFVVCNEHRLIVILSVSQETLRICKQVQASVNTKVFGNLW